MTKQQTSWADELFEDEVYGKKYEWQAGQNRSSKGQFSREKLA